MYNYSRPNDGNLPCDINTRNDRRPTFPQNVPSDKCSYQEMPQRWDNPQERRFSSNLSEPRKEQLRMRFPNQQAFRGPFPGPNEISRPPGTFVGPQTEELRAQSSIHERYRGPFPEHSKGLLRSQLPQPYMFPHQYAESQNKELRAQSFGNNFKEQRMQNSCNSSEPTNSTFRMLSPQQRFRGEFVEPNIKPPTLQGFTNNLIKPPSVQQQPFLPLQNSPTKVVPHPTGPQFPVINVNDQRRMPNHHPPRFSPSNTPSAPAFNNGPSPPGFNNGPSPPGFYNGPSPPGFNNGPSPPGFNIGLHPPARFNYGVQPSPMEFQSIGQNNEHKKYTRFPLPLPPVNTEQITMPYSSFAPRQPVGLVPGHIPSPHHPMPPVFATQSVALETPSNNLIRNEYKECMIGMVNAWLADKSVGNRVKVQRNLMKVTFKNIRYTRIKS